jgi:hypothetical protein
LLVVKIDHQTVVQITAGCQHKAADFHLASEIKYHPQVLALAHAVAQATDRAVIKFEIGG